jgi:hypothetical protein
MTYVKSNVGDGHRGTHLGALCQRDMDYCWKTLLISSISCPEEKASGPSEKMRLGWRVICIVIVASGWRGDAARGCALT